MLRSAFYLVAIATTLTLYNADTNPRETAKGKLAPLQDYIGEWKGVGQRERGKSEGGWIEKSSWAWQFSGDSAELVFRAEDATFLSSGTLVAGKKEGEYQLTITGADKKTKVAYSGKLDDGKLVFDAEKEPAAGMPSRVTLRQTAAGKRMVALYEAKGSGDRFNRIAEVGYTRVGSGFGQGSQGPECIVTGGYGSIEVAHGGKKYFVCCTGCKEYFDEDPKRAVEEYLAKKKK